MRNISRLFCPFIFLLLWLPAGFSAPPARTKMADTLRTAIAPAKASRMIIRHFDRDALKEYRSERAFNYSEGYHAESLWDRFWNGFWDWFRRVTSLSPKKTAFFKYLVIAVLFGTVVYAVMKYMGLDLRNIGSSPQKLGLPGTEVTEDIHLIDFQQEIEAALAIRNYKLAVRLLYLDCLKQLNDRQFIYWSPNKTNGSYVAEIADAGYKQQFRQLTYQFEFVWYGDFAINTPGFEQIRQNFATFNQQMR